MGLAIYSLWWMKASQNRRAVIDLTWARRHPAGKRALEALGQSAAHSEDAGQVPARPGEELDGLRRSFAIFSKKKATDAVQPWLLRFPSFKSDY
jgi:hypothetical protein